MGPRSGWRSQPDPIPGTVDDHREADRLLQRYGGRAGGHLRYRRATPQQGTRPTSKDRSSSPTSEPDTPNWAGREARKSRTDGVDVRARRLSIPFGKLSKPRLASFPAPRA